jgi:hypothetical protein
MWLFFSLLHQLPPIFCIKNTRISQRTDCDIYWKTSWSSSIMNHLFSGTWASTLPVKSLMMIRGSRSHFIVHIFTTLIKQKTPLTHVPVVHDIFPIYFKKFLIDLGKVNFFLHSKIEAPNTPDNWQD